MYKIDTLNLSNNPKVNQGFKDSLGVEDLTDVNIEVNSVIVDNAAKTLTVVIDFTSNNFKQQREMTFQPSDLTSAERTYLQGFLTKAENFMLSELPTATPI